MTMEQITNRQRHCGLLKNQKRLSNLLF